MCSNCFDIEFSSFPTEIIWLDFNFELTKKLSDNKMKCVETKKNNIIKDNYTAYECVTCGLRFRMSDPDYSYRGYFLIDQNTKM